MNRVHPEVKHWLQKNNQGELIRSESVGGGCVHQALLLETEEGIRLFLKQSNQLITDMFKKEARGLEALRIPEGPVVPKVFLVGDSYLLLEDLQPASRCQNFWQSFGRQLALIHNQINDHFGFQEDNYIGKNPQYNDWLENGHDFFRERRLKPQLRMAQNQALLNTQDLRNMERLMKAVAWMLLLMAALREELLQQHGLNILPTLAHLSAMWQHAALAVVLALIVGHIGSG